MTCTTLEHDNDETISTTFRLSNDYQVPSGHRQWYQVSLLPGWRTAMISSLYSILRQEDTTVPSATRRTVGKLDCDFTSRDMSGLSATGVKNVPKDSRWREITKITWWNMKDEHFLATCAINDSKVKTVCWSISERTIITDNVKCRCVWKIRRHLASRNLPGLRDKSLI